MQTVEEPSVRGSRLASNALLNLAGLIAPLIVAFITLPIMIRGLGTERFGLLSVTWLLLTYLSELGFGVTTTRYAAAAIGAGRHAEIAGLVWTTAAFQAVVGLAMGILLALITPWLIDSVFRIPSAITAEARACFYLLALSLPLLGWGRAFRGLVEAAQRFDLALFVHLPITAGTYIAAAIAAAAGWSVAAVMALIVSSRVIALPAYYAAARRALPSVSLRPALRLERLREVGSFAGWVAVSTAVSPLLLYLDRFMIGALLSLTAVTFYAAPYEIVARLTLIPGAVIGALFPALSQLSAHPDRSFAEQLAARSAMFLFALLAPVIVFMLGIARDGLSLWLGAEYAAQSTRALQILAIGVLVNALAHVPYALLHGHGRPDLPARFHLLELPIQVALAWLLITQFGITGAALAWTLRMIIDAALLFIAAERTQLLRAPALRGHMSAIAIGTVCAASVSAVIAAAYLPSLLMRVLAATLLALAAAAVLWLVALPISERRRVSALFRPAV
ncbi:MAG TPA: flippase [Longimicrobiales bacterium]